MRVSLRWPCFPTRRGLLALGLLVGLAGCGFALRTSMNMPFTTIGITPDSGAGVPADLVRYFGDAVRPVAPPRGGQAPEVILDVQQESREKVVVGLTASGQVREYELRLKVVFRVRTPLGRELIASSAIEQSRGISFVESAALSKGAEEEFLYHDMQADIVQQLARRLAAIRLPPSPAPGAGS